jgi:hypothetical protein
MARFDAEKPSRSERIQKLLDALGQATGDSARQKAIADELRAELEAERAALELLIKQLPK